MQQRNSSTALWGCVFVAIAVFVGFVFGFAVGVLLT